MPKEYIEYQNEITSADELNEQGRKSDVLVAALEKCEKLEQKLETIKKIIHSTRKTKEGKILAIYEVVKGVR